MSVSPTLRQQIRDWWKEQLDGVEELDVKVVAAKGALALRQDQEFCERFFEEFLQPMIYTVGINLLSQRRNGTTQVLSNKDAASAIGEDPDGWSNWMEHDPVSGLHISLFKMTKEQGLAAARERRTRIEPDLHRIALIELAVGRLHPGQTIGEIWSPDELTVLERRIIVGKPKISLGPLDHDMRKEIAA